MYRRSLPYCQPPPGFSSGQRVRSSRDRRSVSVSSGTRIVNGDVGIVIIFFLGDLQHDSLLRFAAALATLDIEIPGFAACQRSASASGRRHTLGENGQTKLVPVANRRSFSDSVRSFQVLLEPRGW